MSVQAKNGVPVALSVLLGSENGAAYRETNVAVCSRRSDEALNDGLFACLQEEPERAVQEVKEAFENGASVAVVCESLKSAFENVATGASQIVFASDPRAVYARACQALYDFPARKMRVVGVTGTAGKTSLTYILGGVVAESGRKIGLIGSLGAYDGQKLSPLRKTTPEPEVLAALLDKMASAKCEVAIIEVSSIALAEKRVAGIEFDAVCLTNLRRDHLDYHKTVDQYRRVKMQIFSYLKPDGVAIVNVDDRVTDAALHLIDRPVLTVGMQPTQCSVSATPIERNSGEQTFYIVAGTDAAAVTSKIVGKEHIYNCLEAAALGVAWNIELKTVARGVERVDYIPGRMERVDCGQPFGVYLDRANSAESLTGALEALRGVTSGSIYCVLCAPGDGDCSKRPLMGRAAETSADFAVVTRGNLANAQTQEALDDLARGFEKREALRIVPERREAIAWALSHASPDDAVLIVGQEVSAFDDVDENFTPDRQYVKHWLYENQPCAETFWYN